MLAFQHSPIIKADLKLKLMKKNEKRFHTEYLKLCSLSLFWGEKTVTRPFGAGSDSKGLRTHF